MQSEVINDNFVISLVFFTAMVTVQVSIDNAGWYMMLKMLGEKESRVFLIKISSDLKFFFI